MWRGEREVLRGISLDAAAGDGVHVAGPNGAGKTTLLRVIAGLLTPEQGSISSAGRAVAADRDAWCASFSYLAHSDGLKPELTAYENLEFEAGLRRAVDSQSIDEVLSRVGLAAASDQHAAFLSAGQRRRLAIARVVLSLAPLWLLDEPFTHLDADATALVSDIIGEHLGAGGAVLMAAHQPPAIAGHAFRRLELT